MWQIKKEQNEVDKTAVSRDISEMCRIESNMWTWSSVDRVIKVEDWLMERKTGLILREKDVYM